jgi:ACS family hexuronate transporter-like MFS transporter
MLRGYRWKIVALLFCSCFINYIDRAAMGVAAPFIVKEFHFTPVMMGMIFAAFFFSFPVFNIVGGYLADSYGPKKTLVVAMIFWSIFACAPAIAWGFASFMVFRILFGIGEGPYGPAWNKMINNWFPATERARAKSRADCGFSLGVALSGPIVGLISLQWSWRVSFVVLTAMGFAWTLLWIRVAKDQPSQHPKVTPEELAIIQQTKTVSSSVLAKRSVSFYMRQPVIIAVALAYFSYSYANFFFMTWFPSYLVMERHLSIKNMTIVSVIPWAVGVPGLLVGGFISDYLAKKFGNPILARRVVIAVGLMAAAITIGFTGLAGTVISAVALMSIGIFCLRIADCNFGVAVLDSVEPDRVGGVEGFVHAISNVPGIIAPSVTGILVQVTHQFTSAYLLAGGILILGSLGVALFAKPIREMVPEAAMIARP